MSRTSSQRATRPPVRIAIEGHVPGKKNAYKRSANGRMHRDAELTAAIDALTWQVRRQWAGMEPIPRARIHARFVVRDGRGDLDNKLTTVQDVLVSAGVIANDSIARIAHISAEASIGTPERVEIEVEEQA